MIHDCQQSQWLRFDHPLEVLTASRHDEVMPLLARVENAVRQQGHYAAGFISYEAAPAFDPALRTHSPRAGLPLAWFALLAAPEVVSELPSLQPHAFQIGPWQPSESLARYTDNIARIKNYIAQGDTYQVNYTFRLRSPFKGDPWQFFLALEQAQPGGYTAYIDGGDFAICSASPELFFALNGHQLRSKPMKGTAKRGRSWQEDEEQREWLQNSEKNRAENVMIVDMVRNDMGRVAEIGSVQVPKLFEVERYPTLLQMTSTVVAQTRGSLPEIFAALFPCASITGAPKVRTMQLIAELEATPRGVYTGTIGFLAPQKEQGSLRAQFNVAIRTVLVEKRQGWAEYGVGGGIVWDSQAAEEYEECRIKAQVLTRRNPTFSLLESLRWEPEQGFWLLERHLQRLQQSAAYFGIPLQLHEIRQHLAHFALTLPPQAHKVRLLVSAKGKPTLEAAPLSVMATNRRLGLARHPVDSSDPFLFHKTDRRAVYEKALKERPDCDDVLLYNERGEITESCIANVVVKFEGKWYTPALSSGLLPGTLRAELLARGLIIEKVIRIEDLARAQEIFLINSVRGWMPVVWVDLLQPELA